MMRQGIRRHGKLLLIFVILSRGEMLVQDGEEGDSGPLLFLELRAP